MPATTMPAVSQASLRIQFPGSQGYPLAARLDMPAGAIRAYALFAHCFTCSKDLKAAKTLSVELSRLGIAVLRFDFTGLGSSEGEFANTNFSSNRADLLAAADYLRNHYEAPALLIGHSLGGAAVLSVAPDIEEAKAVVTLNAPSDVSHVIHNFDAQLDEIEREGKAEVTLAGRSFTVQRQFIEDAREQNVTERLASMKKALLVLHTPIDDVVSIDHAATIFQAARHPKSFMSLDQADHLLSKAEDSLFAARLVSAWADRYLEPMAETSEGDADHGIRVAETGNGKFQNYVLAGRHKLLADEPLSVGGMDSGPSPYDYLSIALGACTSMTIRMYAAFKKVPLERVSVDVSHAKIHAEDCHDCDVKGTGKIDQFTRVISLDGELTEAERNKLLTIADKCPVHKTLEQESHIVTRLA